MFVADPLSLGLYGLCYMFRVGPDGVEIIKKAAQAQLKPTRRVGSGRAFMPKSNFTKCKVICRVESCVDVLFQNKMRPNPNQNHDVILVLSSAFFTLDYVMLYPGPARLEPS